MAIKRPCRRSGTGVKCLECSRAEAQGARRQPGRGRSRRARIAARTLRGFEIESGAVREANATGKDYKLENFEAPFSRYLSAETSQASQPA